MAAGNNETVRKSRFNANRMSYASDDCRSYIYRYWDIENMEEREIEIEVGCDGVTVELIMTLDESDYQMDVSDDREERHRAYDTKTRDEPGYDHEAWIESLPDSYKDDLSGNEDEPEEFGIIRTVIETECNERQQRFYYSHFGMSMQMEEFRKKEIAETGKTKSKAAILNVKNDVIRKAANALGVEPVKRNKRKNHD